MEEFRPAIRSLSDVEKRRLENERLDAASKGLETMAKEALARSTAARRNQGLPDVDWSAELDDPASCIVRGRD